MSYIYLTQTLHRYLGYGVLQVLHHNGNVCLVVDKLVHNVSFGLHRAEGWGPSCLRHAKEEQLLPARRDT